MPNERHYSNELNLESVGINLPYNMQAEQSVLGAVLLKPETLTDLVEIIRPEMFYTRQNAQIYSEMLRLFTADQTIDFVTLLDAVISDGVFPSADEAKVYLTGLAETVPSISNVKAYAQIVQEKYLVRQLMGVAKDILQDAGDEPDADLLLENAEQRIYEIRSGRDSSALTPLSSSMVETLTNLQKISGPDADKYKGIPTGFRLLDTVLTGLGRGDRRRVVGRGLALFKGDGAGRARGQTVAQAVAVVLAHKARLAVHHGDGPLVAGAGAGAAAVALFFINANDLAKHGLSSIVFLCERV